MKATVFKVEQAAAPVSSPPWFRSEGDGWLALEEPELDATPDRAELELGPSDTETSEDGELGVGRAPLIAVLIRLVGEIDVAVGLTGAGRVERVGTIPGRDGVGS